MPDAAPRLCPRCATPVARGQCPRCARPLDRRPRGTDTERGYGWQWARFVKRFYGDLVAAGISPVCGAALPDGPPTATYSQCHAAGFMTWETLQVDHEPPLTEAERTRAVSGDRSAVDDARRVGLLCAHCHEAKTRGQSRPP